MSTVAFDTETKGLAWFDEDERAFLGTWADAEDEYLDVFAEGDDRLQRDLEQADVIVGHNLPFDIHQLRATTGFDVLTDTSAELWDTDLMSRVMFPEGQRKGERGGHGLKNLATIYVKPDADEAEKVLEQLAEKLGHKTLKKPMVYYDIWRAYPDDLEHYALEDARVTYDLFQVFQDKLTPELRGIIDLERKVMPILIRAEARGTRVDPEAVEEQHQKYKAIESETREVLVKEWGEQALGGEGSEQALEDALLSAGIPLHRTTDSGKLATNQFALAEFEKDFPIISTFFEFRTASKFLSTYTGPMRGREIVHPSFSQLGAWTSRMSCRRPNMQNIPKHAGKEVRSMFVPRDGHVFVVSDYEGIEMRLIAYYLGDQRFRENFTDPAFDPHAWMASNIHGGEMKDYYKGTPGEDDRATAKNVLFAISYGAGAPRVMDMTGLSKDDAKALIAKIKSSLPGYYKLMKRIRAKIEDVGYVNTLLGRKQIVSPDKSYVGLNAIIQGSAAEIMKLGLVNVDAAVKDLGATPLLVVHDEVVTECPVENAKECQQRQDAALRAAVDLSPALEVDSSIVTTSYADA